MPAGLTLRPGRQKDFFMKALGEHYPGLVERYGEIYAEERASGVCTREYRAGLDARIAGAARDAGIPFLLPHAVYRNRVPLYDELHLLLRHMVELYAARRVPTAGLVGATRRYETWLIERKRIFNRKRSLRQEVLEQETRSLFKSGSAFNVLGNAKLASFLGAVALERKVFDYLTLSLSAPAS
jgi:hypothetical protein